MNTNFRLRSFVGITFLLTAAACGACSDEDEDDKNAGKKDEKTPLKFSLTPPAAEKANSGVENSKNTPLTVGDLIIKVTEGKDDADNYKVKISGQEVFTDNNYTTTDTTADSQALFEAPIDGTSLKAIFNEDVLEKDKTKSIPVIFKSQAKDCTSKSGKVTIAIVDKDGNVVSGPVEVKWTDGDVKTPLQFKLTAPVEKTGSDMEDKTNKILDVGDLNIEVKGGRDDTDNYTVQVSDVKVFTDNNYTTVDGDANSKALFEDPIDGATLKAILNEEMLEKGDIIDVPVKFKSQANACTSKSGTAKIAIVNKDGNVVGAPVEVKWKDA